MTVKIEVPSRIQIGGHYYKVIMDDRISDFGQRGDINYLRQKITVRVNSPISQRSESLVHEVIHFINQVYCNGSLEERDIDPLSEGLWQFLSQLGIELDWSNIEVIKEADES